MLVKRRKSYEISENEVTSQHLYLSRRNFIKGAGAIAGGALLAACRPPRPELGATGNEGAQGVVEQVDESAETITEPVTARPTTDELGDPLNSFDDITGFNNYYEFTTDKQDVRRLAKDFVTNPWQIEVGGHVNKPGIYDIDALRTQFDQEERIYRLRCVEAWSMVIPWVGFPLHKLLKEVEPTAQAKYVRFETLHDPDQMPGQASFFSVYDWPYTEGLTIDEAMNDLVLMSTGIYGEDLLPQNGAPIRLVVPWKYGFKSIKSIVRIDFVDEQPNTLWNTANSREYGFFSNVNPNVNHPRWSQETERRIGENGRRPTLMFNGYEEQVAHLYDGMDLSVYY